GDARPHLGRHAPAHHHAGRVERRRLCRRDAGSVAGVICGDEGEWSCAMERVTLVGRNQQRMKRTASTAAPKVKKPKAERNRLSSVATAIRLLKAFSEEEEELGVSALALKLGVAKSTVHRLAVTLVSEGLLEQDPKTERYRLGIGLFGLGTLVRRRMNL